MDLENIVAELKAEIVRITNAIGLLEGNGTPKARVGRPPGSTSTNARPRRKGGISAAGRRKLSEAMKRRWAQRNGAKGAVIKTTPIVVATPKRKGGMSAAGRRNISLAMKKRWAEKKRKES